MAYFVRNVIPQDSGEPLLEMNVSNRVNLSSYLELLRDYLRDETDENRASSAAQDLDDLASAVRDGYKK